MNTFYVILTLWAIIGTISSIEVMDRLQREVITTARFIFAGVLLGPIAWVVMIFYLLGWIIKWVWGKLGPAEKK